VSERTDLPPGWIVAKLEDISDIIMGQSPPSSSYNENGEGLPFFQGKTDFTDLYPRIRKWCDAPGKIAELDDILLSVRAPVGPTNLAPSRCCIGRGLAAIRPMNGVDVRYVLFAIRAFNTVLSELGTGTTFDAVSGDHVRAFEIPLAPTNGQRRIVQKIEELFTELDAGVAALERVRANLKRYRAAVLKAAVEGALTADWRARRPDVEPAGDLLQRILRECHDAWEQTELARYAKAGKTAPKGWQDKYKEPAAPDTTDLPELPEGWRWATVEQLTARSEYGTSVKCDYLAKGAPVLRIPNIAAGELDLSDLKFATQTLHLDVNSALQPGDILMCRTNGSVSLIGKAALVRVTLEPYHTFASYLLRFRLVESDVLPKWLHLFVSSRQGRSFIESHAASSAGQHNISLSLMHSMALPLPPLAEQEQIVAEVERRLSVAEDAEARVAAGLKRAARLRQSILKRAFAGDLVPQDPTDEPASALLERIAVERGRAVTAGKAARGAGRASPPRDERVVARDAGERQLALDLQ